MPRQFAETNEKSTVKFGTDDEKPLSRRTQGPPAKDMAETSHTFFQNCAKIDPQDWGTRCSVYLYRKEPVIDRTGDWHYVDKYDENPQNEDRILSDHGSGKYRLMLNFTKPGATRSATLDTVVMTLINVRFPPKVAPGEWVDDSRNKRWAWAKASFPKEPQNGNPTGQVLETLKVFNDIRRGVADEDKKPEPAPAPAPVNPVSQVRETIQALKELAPQPAPAATENKTLDSIVQLMISQIQAQGAQNTALLNAILQQRNPAATQDKASLADTISVISDKLIPLVEKLKPGAEEVVNSITRRSKMTGWMEMIQPALPAVMEFFKPVGVALAQKLMTPQTVPQFMNGMAGPPPAAPGALPQPQAPATGSFPPILNMIAVPMLTYMRVDADPRELGRDFASWVNEGYAGDPRFAQGMAMARAAGGNSVVVAFKGSPWWMDKGPAHDQASLAEMEAKFTVFVESFLAWRPDEEPQTEDDDVIDITGGTIG